MKTKRNWKHAEKHVKRQQKQLKQNEKQHKPVKAIVLFSVMIMIFSLGIFFTFTFVSKQHIFHCDKCSFYQQGVLTQPIQSDCYDGGEQKGFPLLVTGGGLPPFQTTEEPSALTSASQSAICKDCGKIFVHRSEPEWFLAKKNFKTLKLVDKQRDILLISPFLHDQAVRLEYFFH